MVNERAHFDFAVTEASLREVVARNERGYTQWVYDVLDSWLAASEGEEPAGTSTYSWSGLRSSATRTDLV